MEANGGFEVGTPRVFNEMGKVLEIEGDLYGVGAISCDERCALEVSAGNFNVVKARK